MDLERYKLDLMSEGTFLPGSQKAEEPVVSIHPTPSFNIADSLRLVPKFNEKDPDIFFLLFEHLAEARQ